jgi:short-subunit dehydrogenase
LQHVVITGASSGLGAALARRFAEANCALGLFGRDNARLSAVAGACRPGSGTVETFLRDVTDPIAMSEALSELDTRRPVDVLVANAGIGGSSAIAASAGEPLDVARKIVEVNLLGVINTVVPLLDRLRARKRGHIVIVGSMAGMQGHAESPVYSASKAAVRIYGEGLRRLLAPQGVRVTVVVAGFIATPMSASLPFPRPFEWTVERAASRIIRGIERNEAEIAFPWQLLLAGSAVMLTPLSLRDRLVALSRAWTGHRV